MPVATITIATNRTWKDKDGKQQEEVEYHTVVVFGKNAENAGRYLKKGQFSMASGRLKTRSWEKDGVKQYRTEIMADMIKFGPRESGAAAKDVEDASVLPEYPHEEINPEDIPF
jgi:single-strand DNA-binding protein